MTRSDGGLASIVGSGSSCGQENFQLSQHSEVSQKFVPGRELCGNDLLEQKDMVLQERSEIPDLTRLPKVSRALIWVLQQWTYEHIPLTG